MAKPRKRRSGRPRGRRRAGRRSGLAALLLLLLLLLLLAGVAAAGSALVWLWPRCSGACPSVEALREYTPPQASRVYDRSGELIAHLAPERRIVVPLERIPAHVAGAFLAVEDKRFFEHRGVDYRRVAGALLANVRTRSFAEGFSTLTMQLARNVFPDHLTRAKTLPRKAWEIVLARQIEEEFSKDEILEMYLNQIYLGEGLYGVEAAAQGYFGKSAGELDATEAALLAALPKAPSSYNPRRNPEAAIGRRNLVLSLMADAGVLSAAEAERGHAEPLGLVAPLEALGEAPFYIAAVRQELRERFGPDAETAGLRVYTGVDGRLQKAGAEALRRQLAAVEADRLGNFRGPTCSEGEVADPKACLQGLFVAVDAHTGDVLALVGGRDFGLSQFDRATQGRRQAGSAFKPFVYATAIEAGIPVTTPLVGPDAEDLDGSYRPADHVDATATLDLRDGLRLSSNRAAVSLGERVGVANVVQTARRLGLTTPMQDYPSTVLGAADVVPLELVAAYTAFANNGILVTPRLIRRVEDARGRAIWEAPVQRAQVISAHTAFLTTDLMRDAVDRGTGWRVREAGLPYEVPAAGKTGTTNDAADAWFVGVTPDLAAGVWIGFDTPKRIMAGAGGGTLAAPVWGEAIAAFYRTRPTPPPWIPPMDLISARVDVQSGHLATDACPAERVRDEWFLPGTEPLRYCPVHQPAGVDGWLRRRVRVLGEWLGGTE